MKALFFGILVGTLALSAVAARGSPDDSGDYHGDSGGRCIFGVQQSALETAMASQWEIPSVKITEARISIHAFNPLNLLLDSEIRYRRLSLQTADDQSIETHANCMAYFNTGSGTLMITDCSHDESFRQGIWSNWPGISAQVATSKLARCP